MELLYDKHEKFVVAQAEAKDTLEYWVSQHLRVSGMYWGVCALALMRRDASAPPPPSWVEKVPAELSDSRITSLDRDTVIDGVKACLDPRTGAFGGAAGHDAHLLHTLSSIQLLLIYGALDDVLPATVEGAQDAAPCAWSSVVPSVQPSSPRGRLISYIVTLQRPDGSIMGDKWGEVDTRFAYCASAALSLLGALDAIDVAALSKWVISCQNWDGGFGVSPGAESHGGQLFCAVGALAITGGLANIDRDRLAWWLAERQCPDGGLNGRPEKKSDVCYSWWIVSCLAMLDRIEWIDVAALVRFIVSCQDDDEEDGGGFGDKPGNQPDIYHTFFATAGLSLLSNAYRRGKLGPVRAVGTDGKVVKAEDAAAASADPSTAVRGASTAAVDRRAPLDDATVEALLDRRLLRIDPHFAIPPAAIGTPAAPRCTFYVPAEAW